MSEVPQLAAPPPGGAQHATGAVALDSLSFLDLIYAVPVGDLAMRVSGADLGRVSAADWSALAVVLAVIVLSWIGLHRNRAEMARGNLPPGGDHGAAGKRRGRQMIGDFSFRSLRFVQFLIEVVIIGLYFAMGLNLKLPAPGRPAMPLPDQVWLTVLLVAVYAAYLVWDLIDVRLAGDNTFWRGRATDGRRVTLISLLIMAAICLMVSLALPRTAQVAVAVNLVLMALLYLYRAAQDTWGSTRPS